MVFPSIPVYLDPPNWNQLAEQQGQQVHHPGSSSGGGGSEVPGQLPPRVVGAPQQREDGMAGLVRPVSMAERARLAKIPQSEPVLKCPRCDSTNTKFCYFNNYSLSQPRHFCKTCRRYWTRGGALRNVPVGGGCRRNKRTKSGGGSSSKSSTTTADRQIRTASSVSSTATSAAIGGAVASSIPLQQQLPFMSSWNSLHDLPNLGLGFTGIQPIDAAGDYHQAVSTNCSVGLESLRIHHQIHQFPFFGGLDPPPPAAQPTSLPWVYPLAGEGSAIDHGGSLFGQEFQVKASSSGRSTQLASVKMEDNSPLGFNSPRQYLGAPARIDNLWGGSASGSSGGGGGGWVTDLSAFNSSSTGNLL